MATVSARDSSGRSDIADIPADMLVTKPLFRFGSGWLYVGAGLAICAAAILVPVQQDLRSLRVQLAEIREKSHIVTQQLKVSSELLDEIDSGDPAVVRRLAASQLNLVPADRTPLMRSLSPSVSVTDWVNARIRHERVSRAGPPPSMIDRMSMGAGRLWLLGVGALCVFLGLLMDPAMCRLRALRLARRSGGADGILAVALEMSQAAGTAMSRHSAERRADSVKGSAGSLGQTIALESQRSVDSVDMPDLPDAKGSGHEPRHERTTAVLIEETDGEDHGTGMSDGRRADGDDSDASDITDAALRTRRTEPSDAGTSDNADPPGLREDAKVSEAKAGHECALEREDGARSNAQSVSMPNDDYADDPADDVDDREEEEEWEYVDERWEGDEPDELGDEDDEYEYEYEYVYVDEDGNEIEPNNEDETSGTAA